MANAIDVTNLWVAYKGARDRNVEAVRDLSFTVSEGEIVGFLGPNGAGKSSTIKALMGFVPSVKGQATIFDLPAGSVEARSLCGYLPEVALYYPLLNPVETLVLYGELQGLHGSKLRDEVHNLLERVGLAEKKRVMNKNLSKGMLQRVGIAQSLLGNPKLLILDEVTSGLDPIGRQELRHLLKEYQARGTTLFFSSHELAEVDMLCDRILVIRQGQLVEERNLAALKDELRNYSIAYRSGSELRGIPQTSIEEAPGQFRVSFHDKTQLIDAMRVLHQQGAEIVDIVSQEGSLEDYFIETVRRAA